MTFSALTVALTVLILGSSDAAPPGSQTGSQQAATEHTCGAAQQPAAATHSHDKRIESHSSAMPFDQARTWHHFRLRPTGGVIEVHVNSLDDRENRDLIAAHLQHIAAQFGAGNFSGPLATHGEEPPGVPVLKLRQGVIRYTFEPSAVGGRVVIVTRDDEALAAVHEFLRYQIRAHRTGDPITIE